MSNILFALAVIYLAVGVVFARVADEGEEEFSWFWFTVKAVFWLPMLLIHVVQL